MIFAADSTDGPGPSNEMCLQLQPKRTKVTLYYNSKSPFNHHTLLARWSTLVLKVGVLYG